MTIQNQIIQALEEIKEPSIFEKYRAILKDSKKLKRNDWLNLRQLMKTDFIYEVIQMDLTSRENKIIGNCIKSISLRDINRVMKIIIEKKNYHLLEALLKKGKKSLEEERGNEGMVVVEVFDNVVEAFDNVAEAFDNVKDVKTKKNTSNNTSSLLNVSLVQPLLLEMINLNPIRLIHLHLFQTVYQKYPFLIEEKILDFCKGNPHEICQEIIKGIKKRS